MPGKHEPGLDQKPADPRSANSRSRSRSPCSAPRSRRHHWPNSRPLRSTFTDESWPALPSRNERARSNERAEPVAAQHRRTRRLQLFPGRLADGCRPVPCGVPLERPALQSGCGRHRDLRGWVATVLMQTPTGAIMDATTRKRLVVALAALTGAAGASMLVLFGQLLPKWGREPVALSLGGNRRSPDPHGRRRHRGVALRRPARAQARFRSWHRRLGRPRRPVRGGDQVAGLHGAVQASMASAQVFTTSSGCSSPPTSRGGPAASISRKVSSRRRKVSAAR